MRKTAATAKIDEARRRRHREKLRGRKQQEQRAAARSKHHEKEIRCELKTSHYDVEHVLGRTGATTTLSRSIASLRRAAHRVLTLMLDHGHSSQESQESQAVKRREERLATYLRLSIYRFIHLSIFIHSSPLFL
jgi:predicted RNA-binding protein YlqC (UPF0109 family)